MKTLREYSLLTEVMEAEIAFEQKVSRCEELLRQCSWYEVGIFELYMELGSFRKVAQQTKIPHMSIYETVKKVRTFIKDNL